MFVRILLTQFDSLLFLYQFNSILGAIFLSKTAATRVAISISKPRKQASAAAAGAAPPRKRKRSGAATGSERQSGARKKKAVQAKATFSADQVYARGFTIVDTLKRFKAAIGTSEVTPLKNDFFCRQL